MITLYLQTTSGKCKGLCQFLCNISFCQFKFPVLNGVIPVLNLWKNKSTLKQCDLYMQEIFWCRKDNNTPKLWWGIWIWQWHCPPQVKNKGIVYFYNRLFWRNCMLWINLIWLDVLHSSLFCLIPIKVR